jgi:universal stress protein A
MIRIENILVPTDFSRHAEYALEYAKTVAKPLDARIHVVHILEPVQYAAGFSVSVDEIEERIWDEAEAKLAFLSSELEREGFRVKVSTRKGFPEDEIIAYVEQNAIDMLFMGTHGWRGMSKLLFGSTTDGVLRHAHCAVVSVRHPQ